MSDNPLAGSLLGQALGDALGFVVEAEPPDVARSYVEEWLRTGNAGQRSHPQFPFGQYTDDTQLARELLRSILERGCWDPAAFATRLARLFADGDAVGAGPGTHGAAMRIASGTPWWESGAPSPYAGNGSAMRAGQLGILFPDEELLKRVVREQSRITHLDTRCAAGALAVSRAVSIVSARRHLDSGEFLGDVARFTEEEDASFAQAIRGVIDWVALEPAAAAEHVHRSGLDPGHPQWQGISAFVIPSVCWSLYAFVRSPDDYWETICTAIDVGGDTDTMAAIAGAISGARVGLAALPQDLLASLNDRGSWGFEPLVELARQCSELVGGSANPRG